MNDAVSRQPIFVSIDVKQGKARYTHLINHTHTHTTLAQGESEIQLKLVVERKEKKVEREEKISLQRDLL